ncbi:MAG: phosphate ABC transporter ATP-binding protein [Theionarchaea archaeon]|nr:phosphate ABC transporter ATP-binding protein [Theionarchaea archaeon]MBU7038090.1 phosphate ABC transporter ATP-binding protein [Theionarchaea archaeon]
MMYHITIKGLNVSYGNHHVLKNVSLEIPRNKITVIIGPSGCGKTTLLKSLNRLLELQEGVRISGSVLVDDESVYDPKVDVTELRKKMGLLSQRPYPLPMSIFDNVAYGPRIHGTRKRKKLNEIVEKNLRAAGLWEEVKDRLKSPAASLSIGQQQRLCLARCLAVSPEIILCDEPTSALDPFSAQKIEETLSELKTDYTIVVVTHNLRRARRLADYVGFIFLGELIEHGGKKDIFENPKDERTRRYISGESYL